VDRRRGDRSAGAGGPRGYDRLPSGGEAAGRSSVDRGKPGNKRSVVGVAGTPPRGGHRGGQRSWLSAAGPNPGPAGAPGALPEGITVGLDAGYDSTKTRTERAGRGLRAAIAT